MSPVETWCRNINYFIPEEGKTKNFKEDQMTKIRKFIIRIIFVVYETKAFTNITILIL